MDKELVGGLVLLGVAAVIVLVMVWDVCVRRPWEPTMADPTPIVTRHNHMTRDVKPRGVCPKCDEYHARREAERCPDCQGRGSVQASVTAGVCIDIDGQWWHDPWSPSCNRCSDPCPSCSGSTRDTP